jgi:hypothetical protein
MDRRLPPKRRLKTFGISTRKINEWLVAAGYSPIQFTEDTTTYKRGESVVVVPRQSDLRFRDRRHRMWPAAEWRKLVERYGLTIESTDGVLRMEATKNP